MIEEFGVYDVRGSYFVKGQKIEQEGKFVFYSDGKIIGRIDDLSPSRISKLVLGCYDFEEGDIRFMEIPRLESGLPALLKELFLHEIPVVGKGEDYIGQWIFLEKANQNLLTSALLNQYLDPPEKLKEIDANILQSFFEANNMFVSMCGEDVNLTLNNTRVGINQ